MSLSKGALVWIFLTASSCEAQKMGLRQQSSAQTSTLQPWLVGLAAVVGFLFIVFVLLIAKRLLSKPKREEIATGYDNIALEKEDEVVDNGTMQTSL